jgi:hypothetical protein
MQIQCCPKFERICRDNLTTQKQPGQALKCKAAIFWDYDLFVVKPDQFVKVAENCTATLAPKEKIISFPLAIDG